MLERTYDRYCLLMVPTQNCHEDLSSARFLRQLLMMSNTIHHAPHEIYCPLRYGYANGCRLSIHRLYCAQGGVLLPICETNSLKRLHACIPLDECPICSSCRSSFAIAVISTRNNGVCIVSLTCSARILYHLDGVG